MKELITSSRQRCFRSCPRKHQLRYELRIDSNSSAAPARFGSLFHVGLEHWALAKQRNDLLIPGAELEVALGAIQARWAGHDNPCPFELARARALMIGYHTRWGSTRWTVLAVEVEFRTALVNPDTGSHSRTYELGGKIDLIIRDELDGRVYTVEHKTTTLDISPGSHYWEQLKLDDQVAIYLEGARSMGYEVAGCIYDVARRPSQVPHKATPPADRKYTKGKGCKACGGKVGAKGLGAVDAGSIGGLVDCDDCCSSGWAEEPRLYAIHRDRDETPDEFFERITEAIADAPEVYYRRGPVVRLEQEIADAQWDTWHTARQIREAQLAGRHVRNPDACFKFGKSSPCSFFPVCTGAASLDDEHLYTRRESAHPELSGTATKGTSDASPVQDRAQ